MDVGAPGGRHALAWQLPDGRVAIRASDEAAVMIARFQLALDDDTAEFHRRFRDDPLLGPSARAFVGWRPLRLPTVSHALLRAFCGQLIESRRARSIEPHETEELLAPYGEWQGLAGEVLQLGWSRGIVPGAPAEAGRRMRVRARRAA